MGKRWRLFAQYDIGFHSVPRQRQPVIGSKVREGVRPDDLIGRDQLPHAVFDLRNQQALAGDRIEIGKSSDMTLEVLVVRR